MRTTRVALVSASVLLLGLGACGRPAAEIVRAVVTAELAQSLHVLPSDISIDNVEFLHENKATVKATAPMHDTRGRIRVRLVCLVRLQDGRWKVVATQREVAALPSWGPRSAAG